MFVLMIEKNHLNHEAKLRTIFHDALGDLSSQRGSLERDVSGNSREFRSVDIYIYSYEFINMYIYTYCFLRTYMYLCIYIPCISMSLTNLFLISKGTNRKCVSILPYHIIYIHIYIYQNSILLTNQNCD